MINYSEGTYDDISKHYKNNSHWDSFLHWIFVTHLRIWCYQLLSTYYNSINFFIEHNFGIEKMLYNVLRFLGSNSFY